MKKVEIIFASDPNFEQARREGKLICGADVELKMQQIKASYYARKTPKQQFRDKHGVLDAHAPLEAFEKDRLLNALGYIDDVMLRDGGLNEKQSIFQHPMGCYPDLWLLQPHKIHKWHTRLSDTKKRIFEFHPRPKKIKQRIQQYADQLPQLRLVFSQVVDDRGEYFYRFLGVYGVNLAFSDQEYGAVWQLQEHYFCFEYLA